MSKGSNKLTKTIGWPHVIGGILAVAIVIAVFSITKKAEGPMLPTADDVLERLDR